MTFAAFIEFIADHAPLVVPTFLAILVILRIGSNLRRTRTVHGTTVEVLTRPPPPVWRREPVGSARDDEDPYPLSRLIEEIAATDRVARERRNAQRREAYARKREAQGKPTRHLKARAEAPSQPKDEKPSRLDHLLTDDEL